MNLRFALLVSLCFLPLGCRSESPDAAEATPPPALSVRVPALSPQAATPPPPSPQPGRDDSAATAAFLQALSQTVRAKANLDKESAATLRLISPQQSASGPGSLQSFVQATQDNAQRTKELLDTLSKGPVPPDAQSVLRQYRAVYEKDIALMQAKVALMQAVRQNPVGAQGRMQTEEIKEEQYQKERKRAVANLNTEIERLRISSPTIESQVGQFGVQD